MIVHAVHGKCNDLATDRLERLVLLTQAAEFGGPHGVKCAGVRAQDGPLSFLPFMERGPISVRRLAREVGTFVPDTQDCFVSVPGSKRSWKD